MIISTFKQNHLAAIMKRGFKETSAYVRRNGSQMNGELGLEGWESGLEGWDIQTKTSRLPNKNGVGFTRYRLEEKRC